MQATILPRPSPTISKSGSGVGSRGPATKSPPRKVDRNMVDRELLIRTVLEVVRECQGTDKNDEKDRGQCFSCRFLEHGVNRCTQLNRSFPYLMPGWSVELRDGEYRASKPKVNGHDSTPGKEGWFGREGQPPGPSVTITRLTQVGAVVWFGIDRKMTIMDPDGSRMCRAFQFWGALLRRKRTAAIVQYRIAQRWLMKIQEWTLSVVQRGGGSHQAPLGRLIKTLRRQMRPARNGGPTRRMMPTGRNETGKKSSSRLMPIPAQTRSDQAGWKTKSDRLGGIRLTAVAEPPLPEAGGGG